MSTEILEKLRSEALALTELERAELANELIKSLDGPADHGVAEAWDKEIMRRIAQIDSGQATLLSLDEFRRRMPSSFDMNGDKLWDISRRLFSEDNGVELPAPSRNNDRDTSDLTTEKGADK